MSHHLLIHLATNRMSDKQVDLRNVKTLPWKRKLRGAVKKISKAKKEEKEVKVEKTDTAEDFSSMSHFEELAKIVTDNEAEDLVRRLDAAHEMLTGRDDFSSPTHVKDPTHVVPVKVPDRKRKSPDSVEALDSPLRKKRRIEAPGAPTKPKRSEAAQQTAAKHWCFTWNNPPGDDAEMYALIKEWATDYVVFQREIGESGNVHLQGYCEFTKPMRFNSLKKQPFGGMFTWVEVDASYRPIIIIK